MRNHHLTGEWVFPKSQQSISMKTKLLRILFCRQWLDSKVRLFRIVLKYMGLSHNFFVIFIFSKITSPKTVPKNIFKENHRTLRVEIDH